jgi:hypothetical protein
LLFPYTVFCLRIMPFIARPCCSLHLSVEDSETMSIAESHELCGELEMHEAQTCLQSWQLACQTLWLQCDWKNEFQDSHV